MQRHCYQKLIQWKENPSRAPLILKGSRQVGKTWLLEQFGRQEFSGVHIFNFEKHESLSRYFEQDLDPQQILQNLSYWQEKPIYPTDLVIFDEVQACPRALTSLKYFCEDLPQQALCCAGSLLGIQLQGHSFPVGKVEFMTLYPFSFSEYVQAQDSAMLQEAYAAAQTLTPIPIGAHELLLKCLKSYFVIGGMPAAILKSLECHDAPDFLDQVRQVQHHLVQSSIHDFSKHAGKINAMHIHAIYENIPKQLASVVDQSTKRYRFKGVLPGKSGYPVFEGPIQWLSNAGLLHKISICERAEIPLKAFAADNRFKLFLHDIGILGATLGLTPNDIMDERYQMAKGFFIENYVAQELVASGKAPLYSWSGKSSEIEFIFQTEGEIQPLEVKASHRTRAKSLSVFMEKYSPSISHFASSQPYEQKKSVTYWPLYLIEAMASL